MTDLVSLYMKSVAKAETGKNDGKRRKQTKARKVKKHVRHLQNTHHLTLQMPETLRAAQALKSYTSIKIQLRC